MFYGNRVLDIKDGLPKWAGMQDKSELIEDSPPEAIKKRKREIEEEEREAKKTKGGAEGKNSTKEGKKEDGSR